MTIQCTSQDILLYILYNIIIHRIFQKIECFIFIYIKILLMNILLCLIKLYYV